MGYPKGTGKSTKLGSFLLLSEEQQMEKARRIYGGLPQESQGRMTVEDVREILVARAFLEESERVKDYADE
jgi:hypothetical protein